MKMKNLFFILGIAALLFATNACTKKETVPKNKIKVGVFAGNGVSPICVLETLEALKIDTQIQAEAISSAQIMNNKLDSIDVLIFPGGSGSQELNNLGINGAKKVKNFVENGKKILGICAGGFILSTTPTYPSLKIAAAKNIDRKHYHRGRGLIQVALTKKGEQIFPELKNHKVFLQYFDGPILEPLDSNNIKYTELAKYVTDIHAVPGTPSGITPGKTFMLTQKIGKGKIFIIGGHAESTPGMRWMVPRMVRFLFDGKIVKYPDKWIHPEINDSAIMFTPKLQKIEKNYFWNLLNDTPQVRIEAMKKLHALRSRPAVRWTMGMLRDNNPQVRQTAAFILEKCEYTAALPDIKQAIKNEKNPQTLKQLKQTENFLSSF
jgi:glutamine amidotransferase PdxT